ncbi:Rho GTPase activation protein [Cantharellus anzutake]|uniref:Rho GTPase activation protein n=1 Tax=Cantharellus anzutake TaxID=1750568 RepID=UPI00190613ED|nr:Rho GTPase activation protein [Cantharellus anzutake]KAF8335470.1 Rho GTPase activation protein [Cantharellus anzutake]
MSSHLSSSRASIAGSAASQTPWVLEGVLVLRSSKNSRYRASRKKDRSSARHPHDGQEEKRPALRERASWRNIKALGTALASQPVATAQWRRSKLKLTETLHPYSHSTAMLALRYEDASDEIVLYINHCNSTDIRVVDPSLFDHPNCIGIYNNSLKNNAEHVFIRFPSPESFRYWFALLRAFAIPEVYGAGAAPSPQGGTYRVTRSVEIEIQHGRNIGTGLVQTLSAARKANPSDLTVYGTVGFGGGAHPSPLPHLNVGNQKRSHDPFQPPSLREQSEIDTSSGADVFCEVELGGDVCARSSTRRSSRTMEKSIHGETPWAWHVWNEKFHLSDLPPFSELSSNDGDSIDHGTLRINVYRAAKQRQSNPMSFGSGNKKMPFSSPNLMTSPSFSQHLLSPASSSASFSPDSPSSQGSSGAQPTPIGSVTISLQTIRRNEWCDGYYPVMSTTQSGPPGSNHVGDLMLNIKCQEDVIVPLDRYQNLIQFLRTNNSFSLIPDIVERTETLIRPETQVRMDAASKFVDLSLAGGSLIEDLCQAVQEELVEAGPQILFRSGSPCAAALQQAMFRLGDSFLKLSLRAPLRRFLSEPRPSDESVDDFPQLLQDIWGSIYQNRHECPDDLRILFSRIRAQVNARFPYSAQSGHENIPLQSITSLCFLRFFSPVILSPGMFGLIPGSLTPRIEKKLKDVSRVIQATANFKDPSKMVNSDEATRKFMIENTGAMREYLEVVSSMPSGGLPTSTVPWGNLPGMNQQALDSKLKKLPVLHRESIPSHPSMIDYPRHLASLSSTIVSLARWPRGVRDLTSKAPTGVLARARTAAAVAPSDGFLKCASICFAIQTDTLTAVMMLNPQESDDADSSVSRLADLSIASAFTGAGTSHTSATGMVFAPRIRDDDDPFTRSPVSSQPFPLLSESPQIIALDIAGDNCRIRGKRVTAALVVSLNSRFVWPCHHFTIYPTFLMRASSL